jgi:hypothetical protein
MVRPVESRDEIARVFACVRDHIAALTMDGDNTPRKSLRIAIKR